MILKELNGLISHLKRRQGMNRNINFSLTYTQTHTERHCLKCKVLFYLFQSPILEVIARNFFSMCARALVGTYVSYSEHQHVCEFEMPAECNTASVSKVWLSDDLAVCVCVWF